MKKALLLILIAAFVFVGATACSNGTPEQSEAPAASEKPSESSANASAGAKELPEITIGWTPPQNTGVFKTATDFMEKAAADAAAYGLDIKVISQSATTHTSTAEQVKILENFIQSKVSCIIISPIDVEAVKPALKEAVDANIPIIVVNLLKPYEGMDISSYIGFDNFQAASVSAYNLLDALGGPGVTGEGESVNVSPEDYLDLEFWEALYKEVDTSSIKGKVAIIEGIAGDFFSNERVNGFHEVIDRYPNIEVVATLAADWDRQKGIAATENILESHPDVNAVWAANNEMGMGAALTIKNQGLQDKVLVVTNDGTQESIDFIKAGDIVSETWHGFPEWGWYGTKFAVMLALGQEVPKTYDIRPRTVYAGNADEFYPNTKLDPIDWQAIIDAYQA